MGEIYGNWEPHWLGGNNFEEESIWKWTDESLLDDGETFWSLNEPNNIEFNNESCLTMITDVNWNNVNCNKKLGSICSISKSISSKSFFLYQLNSIWQSLF